MQVSRAMRWIFWGAVIAAVVIVVQRMGWERQPPAKVSAGEFQRLILDRQVDKVVVRKDGFAGSLRSGQRYSVVVPSATEREPFIKLVQARIAAKDNIEFSYAPPGMPDYLAGTLLTLALTAVLFFAFYIFMMRQLQAGSGQALAFGRSRARRFAEGIAKVTFSDVAGVEEAKQELVEVVDFLKNARRYQALGARIPKGVLLLGPPGCGKTLLGRAVAGEAGVPFFHISGSDFVEMFVGVGASRVRDLFEQAKASRPSIVFIDEIDAVGRQRFAGVGGGHDEREQTLNQLLVEMDGFDANSGVILIAATNRPDVLDPALLRPGRFDRRIIVDAPDRSGREAILKVHVKGKPIAPEVDLATLARRTPGFTGADLANMVNEAALLAARGNHEKIMLEDFEDAIDRVVAGPERKSRLMSEHEKSVVAYHEVGHAVLAELLPHTDPLHKTSITQRGMGLGYTMQLPSEDRYLASRSELLDEITMLMGGRVAEEAAFGEATTGAANDLDRATDLARRMITEFGMSEKLGPVTLTRKHSPPFLGRDIFEDHNYGDALASEIDKEVRQIIENCRSQAREMLTQHREQIDRIVRVLLEKETLEREEFRTLLVGEGAPDPKATRLEEKAARAHPGPGTATSPQPQPA